MLFPRRQASAPAAKAIEAQISDLREQLFAVADAARQTLPYDQVALHVALQAASNALGEAEHTLRESALAWAPSGSR